MLLSFINDPDGYPAEHLHALRKKISNLVDQVNYRAFLTDQHIAPLLADPEWTNKMLGEVKARARAVRRVPIHPAGVDPDKT